MAVVEHSVSRRALLGAALALPALPLRPGLDPGSSAPSPAPATSGIPDRVRDGEKWQEALEHFRSAEAALRALEHSEDENCFGRAVDAFNAALRRLLRSPAPDLAALALKTELAVDLEVATLEGGEACLAVLKQDARRLAVLGELQQEITSDDRPRVQQLDIDNKVGRAEDADQVVASAEAVEQVDFFPVLFYPRPV